MKLLRWKSKYLTGNTAMDERSRSLVDTLNEAIAGANQVEHCADLNDFTAEIVSVTEDRLGSLSPSSTRPSVELGALENQLRNLLVSKLPLAARGTPACDDCGLCSHLEKEIREWLGDEFTNRAKS